MLNISTQIKTVVNSIVTPKNASLKNISEKNYKNLSKLPLEIWHIIYDYLNLDLPNISSLNHSCKFFQEITPKLITSLIYNSASFENLHRLLIFKKLKALTLSSTVFRISSLEGLEKLTTLKELKINFSINTENFNQLDSIAQLPNLKNLEFIDGILLYEEKSIFNFLNPNLQVLKFSNLTSFNKINGLDNLANLKQLEIHINFSSCNLSPIKNLINLQRLKLMGMNLLSLDFLQSLTNLEKLEFHVFYMRKKLPNFQAKILSVKELEISYSHISYMDIINILETTKSLINNFPNLEKIQIVDIDDDNGEKFFSSLENMFPDLTFKR